LTYIISAKCKDGVVIVSDKRIWDDTECTYTIEDKVFKPIKNVLISCSGFKGIIDMLKDETKNRLAESQTTKEKLDLIEDIIDELNKRYQPRLAPLFPRNLEPEEVELVECLVAIGEEQNVRLFKISRVGYREEITENKYGAIGSGEPCGRVFLKKPLEIVFENIIKEGKTSQITNIAHILAFSICMVSTLEVNLSVGGGFDVWYYFNGQDPREASDEENEQIEKDVSIDMDFIDLGQWYRHGKHQSKIELT